MQAATDNRSGLWTTGGLWKTDGLPQTNRQEAQASASRERLVHPKGRKAGANTGTRRCHGLAAERSRSRYKGAAVPPERVAS
jgi:hypothetical protein